MGTIELDYLRSRQRSTWAGWVLLAVALAFAADVSWSYYRTRGELRDRESRLAHLGGQPAAHNGTAVPVTVSEEEITAARDTIRRLSMPWDSLLGTLESVPHDNVALLAIEPDAGAGTVLLSGEAKDYLALLTFVVRLSGEKALRDVHLARHEVMQNNPMKPIAFSISARWSVGR